MATRRLDTRLINDKLKRGWCVSNFANYLGCSEEEFWKIFGQLNEDAQIDFRRRLNNNENKKKRQQKPKSRSSNKIQETAKVPETIPDEKEEEEKIEPITDSDAVMVETSVIEEIQEEKEAKKAEELLKEKKIEEEQLQKEICKFESAICCLNTEKKQQQDVLRVIDAELKSLKNRVHILGEKSEKCISKIQQINENAECFKQKMGDKKKELEEVRTQIKTLETLEIFVYENGDIDLIGVATGEFVVDSIWEKVFQKLRDEEIVEDLTNRQIKLLAKIITYIHVQVNYNVTFEVEELQQAFEKIPDKGLSYFFD